MDWNPDPKILLAIENSVAASRWRIAARFEGPETAARFRRQAEVRSTAATVIITSFAGTVGAGNADRPCSAHNPHRGAE